jgi:hypothetical protein
MSSLLTGITGDQSCHPSSLLSYIVPGGEGEERGEDVDALFSTFFYYGLG